MKNLDFALAVLSTVRSTVDFTVCGPQEDAAYARSCRELAESPPHVIVRWVGPVPPVEVPAVFVANHLFFFPTRGENFGHAIAESLAAGTPVLIADATPWRWLVEAVIGDDVPLGDPVAFAAAIEAMAVEPVEEAQARRAASFSYYDRGEDIQANRRLFRFSIVTGH